METDKDEEAMRAERLTSTNAAQLGLSAQEDEEDGSNSNSSSSSSRASSSETSILSEGKASPLIVIDDLPSEILEFILSYLPPYQDLANCSLVCSRWNCIVKNLIRRKKMNLNKGLSDFKLRWEVFTQHTAQDIANKLHGDAEVYSANSAVRSNHLSPHLSMIAGRFSHSAVRHQNSMYVFGGGSSSDTTFNDLWRFDLSEMRWERPLAKGSYPSPKGSASMVQWGGKLVLFGGWRYPSLHPPYQPWCLFDELHYYDLETQRWSGYQPLPSPPPMAGHSATVHGDRMIIFGGYQIDDGVNSNSNELWCLDLKDYRWWQPRLAGQTKPPARYGQYQLQLDDDHLLVVGGCGGPNSVYSDAWLLDMSRKDSVWSWRSIPVRNKKFAASHMWCNPACKVNSKLVVLGPTPNMPQDLHFMRQTRVPVGGGAAAPRRPQDPQNPYERPRGIDGAGVVGPAGRGVGMAGFDANGAAGVGGVLRLNQAQRQNNIRPAPAQPFGGYNPQGPDDHYFANRRAILNQHMHNANNNFVNGGGAGGVGALNGPTNNNNSYNNNFNNLQPRRGSLRDLHASARSTSAHGSDERNHNRSSSSSLSSSSMASCSPSTSKASLNLASNDNEANGGGAAASGVSSAQEVEAAHRLQRNLALRSRENEPILPKRFDELYEDPFRLAAFNVPNSAARPRSASRDHNERIRRMEEKMNALRNSRRNAAPVDQKSLKEPSPKRVKRNVLSLFVCDLSGALDENDPHIEWVEHKNYGIIPGAPERLILSTMVQGNGELILFGGVHKETLSEITHQVSNSLHFLCAPRDIV